ncbi:MAG: Bifunctional uridylyltransferase/uridylyl-removing enzyme [Actinomycetota bacterium]
MTNSLAEIRSNLLQRSLPISDLNKSLATDTNDWLNRLFSDHSVSDSGIALIAVGGLGRNELTIGSDLDLLLLHDDKSTTAARELAERLWYPIWDSAVGLDHSVRTVEQSLDLANQDLRVLFGLLDARHIAGDAELAQMLSDRVSQSWRRTFLSRISDLIDADSSRHETFGDLAHLQSPNLKEAQGGLRDLVSLSALARTWQIQVEQTELADSKSVLLLTRSALHLVAGKNTDLLVQDFQPDVAKLLKYSDWDELLRSIHRSARTINFSYQNAIRDAQYLNSRKSWFSGRRQTRTPIADGVVLSEGRIHLAQNHVPSHALLLRVALAAAEQNKSVSLDTLATLKASEEQFIWNDEKRETFLALLAAGEGLVAAWEMLDRAGVISMILPHWDAVRFAPQRNSVHKFTVDRHLIETVVEASKLTTLVARPDLLLMSALLHDIGKARFTDHSILGAELSREITLAMGFSRLDREIIEMLVRHHLLLPEIATKRDLDDPATAKLITEHVQSRYLLNLLHQLTIADALATSPIAASPWRMSLIARLVEIVNGQLSGVETIVEPQVEDELVIDSSGIGFKMIEQTGHHLIRVSIPDSKGALANLAGLFSLNRLVVRSAKTKTVGDRAISDWQVISLYGELPSEDLLRNEIKRVITGAIDVAEQLSRREQTAITTNRLVAQPRVTFPRIDSNYTVVEVRAHDAPGMLYRITAAISAQYLDIAAAIVATLGGTVDDVFYLRNQAGIRLSPDEEAELSQAILAALSIG